MALWAIKKFIPTNFLLAPSSYNFNPMPLLSYSIGPNDIKVYTILHHHILISTSS